MRTPRPALLLAALTACSGAGVSHEIERLPLQIQVDRPAYGDFLGDGPIEVAGRVSDPSAVVWVEGREARVGTDGSFRVQVPFHQAYRVIDVEAASPSERLRERIPVFQGQDPLQTWPGGLSLRLGKAGLHSLGAQLGLLIDTQVGEFFQWPTLVELTPSDDGLQLLARLRRASFELDIQGFALEVGMDQVTLAATARPTIDEDGLLSLSFEEPTVTLGEPTLNVAGFGLDLIEDLLHVALQGASGLLNGVLEDLLGTLTEIPLGGPFDFETDLLGSPMSVSVDDLWTDPAGIAGVLGVSFDEDPPPTELNAPPGWVGHGRADLTLAVHEGLIQRLLASELLSMLEQDIELPGLLGNVLATPIRNLPGGRDAPDADGWCVQIAPGPARVARLQPSTAPLARLYLPDLRFTVGYTEGSQRCQDWLVADLELVVDLGIREGTRLELDLRVPGGAVVDYATSHRWSEPEVIDGLGGLVGTMVGLLGGTLDLDLADMFGGGLGGDALPLGDLQPRILASEPMYDDRGAPIEGLYAVSLKLWD